MGYYILLGVILGIIIIFLSYTLYKLMYGVERVQFIFTNELGVFKTPFKRYDQDEINDLISLYENGGGSNMTFNNEDNDFCIIPAEILSNSILTIKISKFIR